MEIDTLRETDEDKKKMMDGIKKIFDDFEGVQLVSFKSQRFNRGFTEMFDRLKAVSITSGVVQVCATYSYVTIPEL